MSAFAALMRKGHGLDVAGILENCLVSLAARGPDRQAFTEVSSFGLACCQLQTTYESLFEELVMKGYWPLWRMPGSTIGSS